MSNTKLIALVAKAVESNNDLLGALNEYLSETNVAETATKSPAKKAPVKKAVEEEVEEAPTKKSPAKKAPAKKAPVKQAVEVEEDEEDEDGEVELPSDFATMKLPELKALAKENGIRIPKDTKIAVVRELILEGLGLAEEVEEEEEEEAEEEAEMSENTFSYEDEDGEEVTVDLEDYDVKGLKELAKEFDIKVPVKLKTKPSIIKFLMGEFNAEEEEEEEEEEADDVEADEDFEEEEDPEVQYGLDELSTEELADILEEAGLKATGKRPQLVARIVKGIEDGTIETADEEEGE